MRDLRNEYYKSKFVTVCLRGTVISDLKKNINDRMEKR
jgi:hypothetical protein